MEKVMSADRGVSHTAFPEGVPPTLQRKLQFLAETFRRDDGLAPIKALDRVRDAEDIQRAADALLELISSWHKTYPGEATDDLPCISAEEQLIKLRFSEQEIAQARMGFHLKSLQNVLTGLRFYLFSVKQIYPTKNGAPKKRRARGLVKIAAGHFRRAGLPLERGGERLGGRTLFAETCLAMFSIAGIVGRDGETLDPDNLIREVLKSLR